MMIKSFFTSISLSIAVNLLPTFVLAQTVDITTLSADDQARHRVGFCTELASQALHANIHEEGVDYELVVDSLEVVELLSSYIAENRQFHTAAKNDLKAKIILGEFEVTQEALNSCNEDLIEILRKNYQPNFSYMEKKEK